jgi:hypothetical protein
MGFFFLTNHRRLQNENQLQLALLSLEWKLEWVISVKSSLCGDCEIMNPAAPGRAIEHIHIIVL